MSQDESKVLPQGEESAKLNMVGSEPVDISAAIAEAVASAQSVEETAGEAPKAPQEEPAKENKKEKKPRSAKKKKPAGNAGKDRKPGVYQTEIPKGGPEVSMGDSVSFLLRDLRARQDAALPSEKASVKEAEKHKTLLCTFDKLLFPVRMVILVLMVLMIGGKQYPWMTLGVLKGDQGVSILLLMTVASLAASWQSVLRGLKDVIYFRFSYETVLLFATVIGLVELASTRNQETYLPLLVMSWCLSGCAAAMTEKGHRNGLRALITARDPMGIYSARRRFGQQDVIGKAPADDFGFVRNQEQPDVWHSGWSLFGILYIFLVLVLSVFLSAKTQQNIFTIMTTLFSVSMPVGLVTACARPYLLLTKALVGHGVLEGWWGAKQLYGKKQLLVYDNDLFPKETVSIKGYKLYGNYDLPTVISCMASMLQKADNGLLPAMIPAMRQLNAGLSEVSQFDSMEGGCYGRIQGLGVLCGTYEFMQLMGVNPPQEAPRNGIFLAIGGKLSAVFVMEYKVTKGAAAGIKRLTREWQLVPTLVTKHFSATPAFVAKQFRSHVAKVSGPKFEARRALSNPAVVYSGNRCGYVLKEGVTAYSRVAAGGRRIYRMGKYLTIASVVMAVMLLFSTFSAISAGVSIIAMTKLLFWHLVALLLVEILARIAVRR